MHLHSTPRLGSILFVRRRTRTSRLIAWVTRGRYERPTLATHVDVFLNDNTVFGISSWKPYVRSWKDYKEELTRAEADWCIFSPLMPFTRVQEIKLKSLAKRLGQETRYSYGELACQLLDGLLAKVVRRPASRLVVFRKLGDIIPRKRICSTTVAQFFIDSHGWPTWLKYGNPDDLFDHVMGHLNFWSVTDHTDEWWTPWTEARKRR